MLVGSAVLYIRSPVSLVVSATLFCGFLWLVSPIDFVFESQMVAVVLGATILLLFIFGLFLGFGRYKTPVTRFTFDIIKVRRIVAVLFCLGFGGLLLRSFEKIYLRGGGQLTFDFIENRELINSSEGSGLIALIGGVFSALLFFLPFYLILLRRLGDRRWRYSLIFLMSMLYPILDILVQGSRSTLVIYLATCVLAFTVFQRVHFKYVLAGVFFFGALVWGAAWIFVIRTGQMGIDPVASMYLSGYSHFAPASQNIIDYLSSGGIEGVDSAIYAFVHFCQYLLHGMYEFFYIANNVEHPTTFGFQSFYIPVKIFISLFGAKDLELIISNGLLRSGVYNSLFGPWFYDFGAYGALFVSLIFGFGSGLFGRLIYRGKFSFLPLYLIIVGLLPFLLIVNLFVSGTGQYALLAALFLIPLLSFGCFKAAPCKGKQCFKGDLIGKANIY